MFLVKSCMCNILFTTQKVILSVKEVNSKARIASLKLLAEIAETYIRCSDQSTQGGRIIRMILLINTIRMVLLINTTHKVQYCASVFGQT